MIQSALSVQTFLDPIAESQFCVQELQYAMRRAGQNPTDVEVAKEIDIIFILSVLQ